MKNLLITMFGLIILVSCSTSKKHRIVGVVSDDYTFTDYSLIFVNDSLKRLVKLQSLTDSEISNLALTKKIFRASGKGSINFRMDVLDSIYLIRFQNKVGAYKIQPPSRYESGHFYRQPCKEYISCREGPDEVYVLIGKQTYFDRSPDDYCHTVFLAAEYNIEYDIVEVLDGKYCEETIKFKALAEGGVGIEQNEYSILWIGNYCGHLRLMSGNDIYRTSERTWATTVDGYSYNYQLKNYLNITRPVPIEFEEQVAFSIKRRRLDDIIQAYPAPFYELKGDSAIAKYGYHLSDILKSYLEKKQNNTSP